MLKELQDPWISHFEGMFDAVRKYMLEYGSDAIELHTDALGIHSNVVICDDLLATGGTAAASVKLVESLGAKVAGITFLIELEFLNGREKISDVPIYSLIKY